MNCNFESNMTNVHSFIIIAKKNRTNCNQLIDNVDICKGQKTYYFVSNDNQIEIAYLLRKNIHCTSMSTLPSNSMNLVLGDSSELEDSNNEKNMAHAVSIKFDIHKKEVQILSSIVGLPPVFVYEDSESIIIVSDIHLLSIIPEFHLSYDLKGIFDFGYIGHPANYRTLFKNVKLLEGGYCLEIKNNGSAVTLKESWCLPDTTRCDDWETFTELQIEAFKKAMRQINLSNSFLSLTAGLDTRAILVDLVQRNKQIPSCTMSGKNLSLDARTAQKLCKHYGIHHNIVYIDEEFYKQLTDCILKASFYSGGLASIGQAHEVWMYENNCGFDSRISGNLGNQIGRGGTEGVSVRNVDFSILHEDLLSSEEFKRTDHWFSESISDGGELKYEFLIRKEIPFSSISNFCIGNHFALQQTPYANRLLIETTSRMPKKESKTSSSLINIRFKDLIHRFYGESELYSFQVKYIKANKGYAASYPINWGWRATGGLSYIGLIMGLVSLVDAIIFTRFPEKTVLQKASEQLNIAGMHAYTPIHVWMRSVVKEFILDTLTSTSTLKSGLFNESKLFKMLEDHYALKNNYQNEINFALDLSLSMQTLKASL